ncbi:Mce-associated membrane protein [Mycobacterium sp. MAA66]|uniref:Mce protein n=1 Tax=Mycobacterium sp. MAA66 TaxID=3156297 RepID=UPI003514913D
MTTKESDDVDVEAVDEDTATEVESDGEHGPRTYRIRRAVCWAVGVLVVLLAAAAVTLGALVFQQHQRDVEAAQAIDAARAYAVTLTTTDQNTIDKNFADITGGATGEFKDAYTKAWSQMRKMLIDNKVSTTGTVIDAAAKAVHGDDVDVLLSVKQVITSSASPDPRSDFVSMSVTMRKVGDKWLAANVLLAGADGKRAK